LRLAALLILTAVAGPGWLSGDDLPQVLARGTLRVILHVQALPEVASFQPGAPAGFEGEMVQAFASLHRLKLEIVTVPNSGARIPALLAGKGDLIIAMNPTESRRKLVNFTSEVFPGGHVVITRRPHAMIETLDQLRRAHIGSTKGASGAEVAVALLGPGARIDDSFATPEVLMHALHAGKLDAVVSGIGWAFLQKRKDPDLELGFSLGPSDGPSWATRKDSPELHKAAEDYVFNLRKTPTWNRLVIKYYGDVALDALRRSRQTP
jgi:ABC-type amino acid transport substrate-binding protein